MKTKLSGMNIWMNQEGQIKHSPTRPDGEWYAAYAERRVHGDTYSPYMGNSEWEQNANREMANAARSNFVRNQH